VKFGKITGKEKISKQDYMDYDKHTDMRPGRDARTDQEY
jgi:hypothetical protein